ncbi:MAG: hypothetical protein QXH86_08475 [Ignisphaera sp.]
MKAEDYYILVLAFFIAFIILSLFSSLSTGSSEKPILTALALFMLALAISLAIAGIIKVYLELGAKTRERGQATQ